MCALQRAELLGGGLLRHLRGRLGVREVAIRQDISWRKVAHFRSGRSYVESLYDHPDRTVGLRDPGALLTPEEYAEYEVRAALERDADLIAAYYESHPATSDTFGGVMIDHAAGGVLAVYLRDSVSTPWTSDLSHPGRLVIRAAAQSLDELRARRAPLVDAWQAEMPDTQDLTGLGIDILHNAVAVYFRPDALTDLEPGELPPSFADRYGTAHLYAKPQDPPAFGSSTVKGGWSWGVSGAAQDWRCLFGLAVTKSTNSNDYMLSAGHCTNDLSVGQNVYHNFGPDRGHVAELVDDEFQNGGNADVSVFRIDFAGSSWAAKAKVVRGHNSNPYLVPVTEPVEGHTVGTPRCHTGKGETHVGISTVCGWIEDPETTHCYNGEPGNPCLVNMVQVEGSTGGRGDSGGPVFKDVGDDDSHGVWAAGIYGGQACYDWTEDDDCPGIPDPADPAYWWYTPLGHAMHSGSMDYDLRISTDPMCKWPGQGGSSPVCPDDTSGDY